MLGLEVNAEAGVEFLFGNIEKYFVQSNRQRFFLIVSNIYQNYNNLTLKFPRKKKSIVVLKILMTCDVMKNVIFKLSKEMPASQVLS